MLSSMLRSDVARFGIVSVLGVVLDLGVGWLLAHLLGVPLTISAATGFVIAACFNYVLHERWTFGGGRELSARRGATYLVVLGLTLATRLVAVAVLQSLFHLARGQELWALVPAVGCSFVMNFLLSKFLVFGPEDRSNISGEGIHDGK